MQILLDWKRKPDWEKNAGLDLIDMDEDPVDMPVNNTGSHQETVPQAPGRAGKDPSGGEGSQGAKDRLPPEEDGAPEEAWEEGKKREAEDWPKTERVAPAENVPEDRADSLGLEEEDPLEEEEEGWGEEDGSPEGDGAWEEDEGYEEETDPFQEDGNNPNKAVSKGNIPGKPPKKDAPGKKNKMRFNLHLILLATILLIAGTAVYRLYRWNQGTPIEDLDTEEVDPSQFDIETLDMILPMDASLLAGREDDGVTTILCLGNNPFSDNRGDTGLASLIAQKTDSVVYDCSFPDSSVACKNATYSPDYPRDHFNLYYVVQWLRNNDFSAVTTIASQEYNPSFLEAAEVLQTVDMDKVDVIIMMYDSTDYNIGTPSDNPNNPYDVTAYTGGLRTTIEAIKETWPYIRIFVMSHTYAQHLDDEGNLQNGTITDLGNGTLNHYLVKESEAAMDCGVSFIDNYYGTINEDNYAGYMTDYMHYNDAGREKLADRIAYVINNRMGVVSSTTSGGGQ